VFSLSDFTFLYQTSIYLSEKTSNPGENKKKRRIYRKTKEGEGVMVFCSKVHWLLCRMILIDSDGHFLQDSERRTL